MHSILDKEQLSFYKRTAGQSRKWRVKLVGYSPLQKLLKYSLECVDNILINLNRNHWNRFWNVFVSLSRNRTSLTSRNIPKCECAALMTYTAEFIEGTQVKTSWLELLLCKTFKEQTKILNVSALGSEAVGYMSVIRRITLEGNNIPSTVIIKTPSCEGGMAAVEAAGGKFEENDRANALQQIFHDSECDFLHALSVGGHNVKVPKIYYTGKNDSEIPCIIMEEIVDCKVLDLIPGFDEAQLYTVVDQIVELQHWSLNNETWRFPISEGQIELEKSTEPMLMAIMTTFFTKHKDLYGDLGDKLIQYTISLGAEYQGKFRKEYFEKKRPSILVHGDMWTANFLWKDDSIDAIVDWQLSHPGNVVEDLMRVLSTCTTAGKRRRLTTSLLNHYYNLLSDKNNGKLPFTREQLDEEMKHYLPIGCIWSTFATAFWENGNILRTEARLNESLDRLKAYLEDTAALLGW